MPRGDPMGPSTNRVPHPDFAINWYRTKLPQALSSELHRASDLRGAVQTVGWLAMLGCWFGLTLWFHARDHNMLALASGLLYGMQVNFAVNGMHELGHGFVFKTKWLNGVFLRVISFLGWLHPDMFFSSHLRHHRYTQNYPHDQENPQPVILTLTDFILFGFLNFRGLRDILSQTVRAALGIYPTNHLWWTPAWEEVVYPAKHPGARKPAMLWAQCMVVGHAAIAAVAITRGWYLVPVLVSLGPFYNGWLFFLCNSTQHIGMHHGKDRALEDFRLSTRSFYLNNPIIQFWYWHMNFHIEHHMYAAVPCYNLQALHSAIKHDLPPTPNGLVQVWAVIIDVLKRQAEDLSYVMPVQLPGETASAKET